VNELIDTTEMYLKTIYELEEEGVVPLRARIAERLEPWFNSGATGLIFRYGPQVQVGRHNDLVEDLDVWGTIAKATHRL